MSSSFLKPSVTPATALATRLRARPWNFPSSGSSRDSFATRLPSSCAKRMPGGTCCRILPFGPCTSTASGAIFTVTPVGIEIGFLPIRDMFSVLYGRDHASPLRSPHIAEHFATDARLAGGTARHHAARRGQDAGAETTEDGRHIFRSQIDAAAGPADPLEPGHHLLAMRSVLEEHADDLTRLSGSLFRRLLNDPESLDVALILEDPRNLCFQLAGRQIDAGVLRRHRIAEAREHVRNRVCHISVLSLKPYQELFVTPVTSPSSASLRKHRRHMSNLRMNARGRPHSLQRLRCRILYFSCFSSLATFAVVAIAIL